MIHHIAKIIAFLAVASCLAAQTVPESTAPVQLSIQFQDQQVYYENDDVNIKLTVSNNSPDIYRFRLADDRMFSVDFGVQNLANQEMRPSQRYTEVRTENKPVFTRDVSILPGESFSFTEKLNTYKELPSGMYVISAYLYPELRYDPSTLPLTSNRLSLSVRPEIRRTKASDDKVAAQVQEVLKAQALPPDQVISFMLDSRMKGKREAYFLYIDAEKLYLLDPRRAEAYRRMAEIDRMQTLDAYRDQLWSNSTGSSKTGGKTKTYQQLNYDNIALSPLSYQILRTSYDEVSATVEVLEKFRPNGVFYTEIKAYKYYLTRRDGVWYLTSYTVTNKGTE